MAVPKKRKSHSRTRMHRNHLALKTPGWVSCAQCGELKRLHHLCEGCGYYRGTKFESVEE
ncbi:MAG: 50S ribosomal protein L32 [Myxococcota bacterium]|nr:50S ribosomal protein L32 [Myxococcota bacterium]